MCWLVTMSEYKHNKLHETIRCQRNWDWDNQIKPDHLAILDEYVAKPPQKQGERMFHVARIHNDMDKVTELHTSLNTPNTHVMSTLVYIWFPLAGTKSQYHASGFHAGIISKLANELGYATGFCGCGASANSQWYKFAVKYNLTPIEHYSNPMFILSIGHGKPDTEYNRCQIENNKHHHHPYNWGEVKTI